MKKNILLLIVGLTITNIFTSCGSCSNDSEYDDEYWQSVSREKTMRDAGFDDAADIEKNKRQNRLRGTSSGYTSDPDYTPMIDDRGEYHTIDGNNRQIQYQGSAEQQRDLEMIDRYLKEHPEY